MKVGGPHFHPPNGPGPRDLPPSGSRGVTITDAYIWAPEKSGLAPFCPINCLEAEFSFYIAPQGGRNERGEGGRWRVDGLIADDPHEVGASSVRLHVKNGDATAISHFISALLADTS
jgi:hypothetical protein